ncbi:CDP-diacylglycerol--glycerol-3-phosphate 3-phosphatidyltransferase [Bacteriovorax sp. Seq25_V]|uniref:CDP-diacylglycerol--glycerol-3-phosphate 3-phosphatidyltransferase n=1 Tax=Bacteriovorax sp. Seq25_V TaxID=1201288 RepID=UPI000402E847|nr:CDP-diacylglycerol--glycerol-3-phosphate 3-phosphatidyltransferase [Bacteriovorax sp. Seq25_V]
MENQTNQINIDNLDKNAPVDEWEIDNLPNRLTILRMFLIPVIIGSLYVTTFELSWSEELKKTLGYVAAWTFVAASITDFFDGYIARKRKIVTVFGSFLDPIADKFLVVSSLILLNNLSRIPVLVVVVLVLREMYMTALRLLAMERGIKVPVSSLGKWKTTFQMIAIPMLMAWDKPYGISFPLLGTIFIYLSFFFSVYSAILYTGGLLQKIKTARAQKKNSAH